MAIQNKIESQFKGFINNYEIENTNIYHSSLFLLEMIEEKFGDVNENFTHAFIYTIERMNMKYEYFSFSELENEFSMCIDNAQKFSDLQFSYLGSVWVIENLNQRISEMDFLKEESISDYSEMIDDLENYYDEYDYER